MSGATDALYEPLIERRLDAIPSAARAFARSSSADELWVAVARFAVLAYSPSQHGKRSVMACRAAQQLREAMGERWIDLIIECARYAAESRQPWSEPPILDPPAVEGNQRPALGELREALAAGDRPRVEHWLAARIDDAEDDLRAVARGDALLMLDTALALIPLLGEKGRFALLRIPLLELLAGVEDENLAPIETLIERAVTSRGAIDAVRSVFLWCAAQPEAPLFARAPQFQPYPLARDYAQTLIAHAVAGKLPSRADEFLATVHDNLEHGESYAEWSFA